MLYLPFAAGLLLLVASSAAGDGGASLLRPSNRRVQEDPCAVSFDEASVAVPTLSAAFMLKPSYVTECFASIPVNRSLALEHIESLRRTFEQYYCFYDIANDAADSNPISFQEELGYSLFSGPLEGQVNLEEELTSLLDTVDTEGATMATFFDIQTIFNKLYDAHVSLPMLAGDLGTLTGFHDMYVFPERNLLGTTYNQILAWTPQYNDAGDLELSITFAGSDGNEMPENIVSIDGMTPYEWYYDLVSKPEPSVVWPYQAIGARLNGAFSFLEPNSGVDAFRIVTRSRPSATLPDSFTVTYATGEVETYYAALAFRGLNATQAYDYVNSSPVFLTPGSAFTNFVLLALTVNETVEEKSAPHDLKPAPKRNEIVPEKIKTTRSKKAASQFVFEETIPLRNAQTLAIEDMAAFSIEDDYAVLKIQKFIFDIDLQGNNFAMVEIWSNFTAAAKAKGIRRAMVDISGNGGGVATSGDALAISMYPFIPYEFFQDQYDQTYNEVMRATHLTIFPFLEELAVTIRGYSNAFLQEYLDSLPEDINGRIQSLLLSLASFCCNTQDLTQCRDPRCLPMGALIESLNTLDEFPTGPQLRIVWNVLLQNFAAFNAFNTLFSLQLDRVDPQQSFEVIRGGEMHNLTNRFPFLTEAEYYEIVARAFQNDWQFDEYVVVSDGTAGSTTAIFSSRVQQLWNNRDTMWNNRDVLPVPLTAVTYGGTTDPSDTTLAGFPASVQGVNIGVPIITAGLLYLLEFVLPPDQAALVRVINEDVYQLTLPIPPYFAEGQPSLPVINYYSRFMDPGATPLQFVKIPSDEHIQKVFTGNSLDDPSDLGALYRAAAKVGFSSTDTPLVPEESEDESSAAPVLEESEDELATSGPTESKDAT
ncbi:expressed unknown protein [Seminavis robusta]|uniref:Tail specific protease domain-containing protein n=1 Tax=Seminavis robusta TaxID=568900 RepID=A0A9N8DSA9_9STRA|nr:expressed unknown protein [Seminavis robusta]|eukprot:Sro334_g119930.1 n/a (876) ;mRNA; f:69779-72593